MTPLTMRQIIFAALIVSIFVLSAGAFAQAKEEAVSNAVNEPLPFTLLIVGTRHYSDVDVIKSNLQKMPSVRNFTQKIASQNHMEFGGIYSGDALTLIQDIEGLAADRFEVKTKNYKDRGLVITLRKTQGSS